VDLDANALLASFFVSTVGLGIFIYGKKQGRVPQLVGGVLLMGFPYFVSNPWLILGIGAGLCALVFLAVRFGL
jgi:hypothetical protein